MALLLSLSAWCFSACTRKLILGCFSDCAAGVLLSLRVSAMLLSLWVCSLSASHAAPQLDA